MTDSQSADEVFPVSRDLHPVVPLAVDFINSFTPQEISDLQAPLMIQAAEGSALALRLMETFGALGNKDKAQSPALRQTDVLGLALFLALDVIADISNDCRNLGAVARAALDLSHYLGANLGGEGAGLELTSGHEHQDLFVAGAVERLQALDNALDFAGYDDEDLDDGQGAEGKDPGERQ